MNSDGACFVGKGKGGFCSHDADGTEIINVIDISECNADISSQIWQYVGGKTGEIQAKVRAIEELSKLQ